MSTRLSLMPTDPCLWTWSPMSLVRACAVGIVAQMPPALAQTQLPPPEPAVDVPSAALALCASQPEHPSKPAACTAALWHEYLLWVREHAKRMKAAP